MKELLIEAENHMKELKHPYVGSEHFMLAFLKKHNIDGLTYEQFKEYIISIIGIGSKQSRYILYTPILRSISNLEDEKEAIIKLLNNEDSIVYNILLSKAIDIDKIISTL